MRSDHIYENVDCIIDCNTNISVEVVLDEQEDLVTYTSTSYLLALAINLERSKICHIIIAYFFHCY